MAAPAPSTDTRRHPRLLAARRSRCERVRVATKGAGAEAVTVAEMVEEAATGLGASWARVAGAWRWRGGGLNCEDGVAQLLPLSRR